MKKCIILLSYIERMETGTVHQMIEQADYIVCADGGQIRALEFGITPDCVIGDFDSTPSNQSKKIFNCQYITYPAEKNLTDTEACLEHVVELGFEDIVIIGGMGGRLDHTLGNISTLLRFSDDNRQIRFIDGLNSMEILLDGTRILRDHSTYHYFSVVPIEEYSILSIQGAKYELNEFRLLRNRTRGISNEFKGTDVLITVSHGPILIVRSSDV